MGCAICKKETDLFELTFEPMDTEANERFTRHVCGSCWEIIATIARRISKHTVEEHRIDSEVNLDPLWEHMEVLGQRIINNRSDLEKEKDRLNYEIYELNSRISDLSSKIEHIDREW